jgi:hypothetical protein
MHLIFNKTFSSTLKKKFIELFFDIKMFRNESLHKSDSNSRQTKKLTINQSRKFVSHQNKTVFKMSIFFPNVKQLLRQNILLNLSDAFFFQFSILSLVWNYRQTKLDLLPSGVGRFWHYYRFSETKSQKLLESISRSLKLIFVIMQSCLLYLVFKIGFFRKKL